jgi:hypothetical protein
MVVSSEMPWSTEQITAFKELVSRVAGSPQLHNSPKLREFFLYVTDCALRQAPEEATEQQIGVHVFHRQPGYNSGDDSIVRSQARLLRAKVNAYFANEGSREPIIIEIPKGQYFPVFRSVDDAPDAQKHQAVGTGPASAEIKTANSTPDNLSKKTRTFYFRWSIFSATIALALGFCSGYFLKGAKGHFTPPALDAFWKPFYASNSALVIYSNPAFAGNPTAGLRIVRPAANNAENKAEQPLPLDETYTGTGEVEAVHTLTALFAAHEASFTLKRSKLVTWDEARSRSLIFIGRSEPEQRLNELKPLTQFYITETSDHRVYIANLHPRTGEPEAFPFQSTTQETAIVALLPGLRPTTRVAVFSGVSTVGTQEAVDFMTQPESIRVLTGAVGTDGHLLKPFEAVLRIDTSNGVPISASFLAIHKH